MKKVVSGVLVIMLALALVACSNGGGGAAGGADPAIGKYVFESMEMSGMSIDASAFESMGMDPNLISLEIKEDGNFSLSMADPSTGATENESGTWKQNGSNYDLTSSGSTISAAFDASAGTMTIEEEGIKMVFKK